MQATSPTAETEVLMSTTTSTPRRLTRTAPVLLSTKTRTPIRTGCIGVVPHVVRLPVPSTPTNNQIFGTTKVLEMSQKPMVSTSCTLCPPSPFTEKTHPLASFWRRWRQPGVSTNSETSISEWTLVMALTSTDTITKMGVSTGGIAMGVRTCASRTDTGSITPPLFQANRLGVRRIVEERQEVCRPCIERPVEMTPSN
jgi:hypothetical protein